MTDMETARTSAMPGVRATAAGLRFQWSPIIVGALVASAVSIILVTFGASLGLGVSSASPTWRDTSIALCLLSGLFLILQALVAFGCGGYVAGRTRTSNAITSETITSESRISEDSTVAEDSERRDGFQGIASWALAVVIVALVVGLVGMAANRRTSLTSPEATSEPSALSYEIDHLLRGPRHLPSPDLAPTRAEAGRILLTSSSHSGVSTDDRTYLAQLASGATGLTGADVDRRVDTAIANSRKAIANARASIVILAFSAAAALLLGAVAAWAGAVSGGRHRDGAPLPGWMIHSSRFDRRSQWHTAKPMP
jgi:hypothetical protein